MKTTKASLVGKTVTVNSDIRQRALAPTFPGWGAPDYADHLVSIEQGWTGVITSVENHGSNPWTRYTIRFANGCRGVGVDPANVTIQEA